MGVQFPGKKRYVTLEWPLWVILLHVVVSSSTTVCVARPLMAPGSKHGLRLRGTVHIRIEHGTKDR